MRKGTRVPYFIKLTMVSEKEIRQTVESILSNTGLFLVDVHVRTGNYIRVLIDSPEGVSIEECARINHLLEAQLNREKEDFELEVSSPGLNSPFKVFRQYLKNINREIVVVMKDGKRINGKLVQVNNEGLILEIIDNKKSSAIRKKRNISEHLSFSDIKSTKVRINI